jgi:transposase
MALIAVGIPNNQITSLTGLCDKSVRTLKKEMLTGEVEALFHVGGGGGQGKLANVESAIIEEIEHNEYHTRQQIADMVLEKFGIKVSRETIRRLLKKTASDA